MNYLCHLYLAGTDAEILTGSFAGDFVKGRLEAAPYPPRIRDGIALHRRTDSFAETHPDFARSKQRLSPHLGLYRSVLVDLFYDHFLAAHWEDWNNEALLPYLARARTVIEERCHLLPERLQQFSPIIFQELLPSYHETEGIARALRRMSHRVRRPNPLAGAEEELLRHYRGLHEDFSSFLPEAMDFAAGFIAKLPSPPYQPTPQRR